MRDLGNYIAGEDRTPDVPLIAVENPSTEDVIGHVPDSTATDAAVAVRAARAAFDTWSVTPYDERSEVLRRLASALEKRAEAIATVICDDVGTPARISRPIQADLPISIVAGYADLIASGRPEQRIGNSLVVREPVGVVAAVTPWNYPLQQIVCKVAPALAAGCTVVLKPSEIAPLVVGDLVEAAEESGLPPGVLNVVHGRGATVGEALVADPDVDMVSFTGSGAVGSHVAALAAGTVKKVTLELGGKSANIILDDADLVTAVKVGVANAFLNAGQTCTAWTRMLVPRSLHDEAVEMAAGFAAGFVPGDPRDPATRLGPLVSAAQRRRVRDFISVAIAEGARVVTGGAEPPADRELGYFVRPTILSGVLPDATVAQSEVFGPVLSIISYDDDDDAVAVANNSRYGLHGAVWSADPDRALAVARRVRTGCLDVNGGAYNPLAPFGGYKQSGIGRELGVYGLEEFEQVKSIQF